MEKESLELLLGQGLSLEQIGKRFGKDPAAVAYWVRKHQLEPQRANRHGSRGGIDRSHLETLVESGATIAEIATDVALSKTAVRYWLRRYGLRTKNKRGRRSDDTRAAKEAGQLIIERTCERHGRTGFRLEGRGYYRCMKCRSEAVARRRRAVKEILVREAGGSCCVCGYDRWPGALAFHHLDPTEKRLEVNARGVSLALATLRAEARKCVLLCANCHAEVEGGLTEVPARVANGESEISQTSGIR